ncbi:hypothetical protein DENIT_30047 [Pseudomonas veronii]|nr:hypothetical protein DENIT_30047 [Pseudomonas veronii]
MSSSLKNSYLQNECPNFWLISARPHYKADIHFEHLHNLRAWYDRVKVRPAVRKALRDEGLA